MNTERKHIENADFLKVFGRALLLQASWSFERMQTLGFAFAVEPVLRKLYPDRNEYEERLKVHLEYFNTQPYCASFILGAVMRLEEDRATGVNAAADVSGLKTALMAPLGAMGDSFFWGALRPLTALIATAVLLTGVWWAPLLFLALYNIWHVGLRIGMLYWGYQSGGDAAMLLARYSLTRWAKRFKIMSLTVLGGMIGMLPSWRPEFRFHVSVPGVVTEMAGLVLTFALVFVLRRGGSPIKLMFGLALLCLALAYAGVV